jgi:hypothetical protein
VTDTPSDTSTVDVAPPPPALVRSTDSPGTSRSPQWTFDTPAGATVDCELDDSDGHAVDSQSSCGSPYDADLTGLDDGQYTLSVTATSGGVTGTAATSSYLLDTTAPDARCPASRREPPPTARRPRQTATTFQALTAAALRRCT